MRGPVAMRRIGWLASVLALVGLPLAFGCDAGHVEPMAIDDGGVAGGGDAAGRDGGPSSDAGAASRDGGLPVPQTGARESDGNDFACGDFLDDDLGDGADCSDSDCARSRICCVESTSAECCSVPATISGLALDLRDPSCAIGTPAAMCASGVTGFGSSFSTFVRDVDDAALCADGTGAMAPQGGDRSDAGLLFDQAHDTGSTAVAIEAHVGIGSSATSSIDAIAIGLTSQTDLGTTGARVRPVAAIVVSATDQNIRVVAGDVALDAHALTVFGGGGCHELDLRLVTSPNGTFDAFYRRHVEGTPLEWTSLEIGIPFQAAARTHPVVYGRTTNPGVDGVHAWARSVGVATQLCDVLAPSRSAETVFTAAVSVPDVRSVSRLDGLAAYEIAGTIYSAGVDGNGRIDTTASPTNPPLVDTIDALPFYAAGAFDPELARIGANVRLYFTGLSTDGVRSIGYVDYTNDLAARVSGSEPRQLFAPGDVGVAGADGATYLETPDATVPGKTRRLLVFRAMIDVSGVRSTELRALELEGDHAVLGDPGESIRTLADAAAGIGFYSRSSPLDPGEALYRSGGDETAFDRDEVAQPELVLYHGIFRIFYAGRRGGRWSIGVLRSPDFQHFDPASHEPVLSGSGVGFDAVSVTDPDVFIEGDQLSLYYSGTNGTETRPGLATQTIPTP
jgi:hypothetical protein